jgi:CRP-like cAMP-binding protein
MYGRALLYHRAMEAIPNRLLAALPRAAYRHVLARAAPITLRLGDVLYEPGTVIRNVYFPTSCLVSLLTLVEGDRALEIGLVGREGIVGIPLALGVEVSAVRALVQGEGPALRMSKASFVRSLRDCPPLRRGVLGYAATLLAQIGQTAACNQFHAVEPRLARWLLMTRDRLDSGEFRMTQQFLSSMLGVRREGVSRAAAGFQQRHLIEYRRGQIKILDHRRLEAAACTCYGDSVDGTSTVPARGLGRG